MKLTILLSTLSISSLLLSVMGNAQVVKNWNLGVSGSTGRNLYDRKYYDQPELPPARIAKLKSNYLWGGAIWAEKYVNRHVAAIGELRYAEVDVPNNMLCECSYTGAAILQDEKHYWGSLGVGLRYYLNPKSPVSFFFDTKADADWLILAKERINDKTYNHWNATGYSHLAPSLSFAFGSKWKRLAVSFGVYSNVARTMVRDVGVYNKVQYAMKTGIMSRGFFVKTSITVFRLR
ncbi:MAG TPA: hypothetical protein VN038_15895 [Dyadobacter sp.]|nr:hypothetical protein [Dyadobacter sp.]